MAPVIRSYSLDTIKKKFHIWSRYAFDFGLLLALIFSDDVIDLVPVRKRLIWADDRSIAHPLTLSRNAMYPSKYLPIYNFFIPAGFILVTALFSRTNLFKRVSTNQEIDEEHAKEDRIQSVVRAILGLMMSVTVTLYITCIIKHSVGRLRPDFLARCDPAPIIISDRSPFHTSLITECRGDPKVILEGRKSFPSGHASFSFAGLTFATLYAIRELNILGGVFFAHRALYAAAPVSFASLIAGSRIVENWHHWEDVLAGSFLGIIIAYCTFRLYFGTIERCKAHLGLNGMKRLPSDSANPYELFSTKNRESNEEMNQMLSNVHGCLNVSGENDLEPNVVSRFPTVQNGGWGS